MGKVAIWNNWENQREVWCHSQQFVFLTHQYLNPHSSMLKSKSQVSPPVEILLSITPNITLTNLQNKHWQLIKKNIVVG